MGTRSRGVVYLDRYPVDLQIRVYPSGRAYIAELQLRDFDPQQVRIGLTRNDLEDLNASMQAHIQATAEVFDSTAAADVREHAVAQLARKGSAAFVQIFGDQSFLVRSLMSDHLEEGATIQISSEEFFLPWELLCPTDPGASVGDPPFWGLRYVVSRALIQELRPGGLRLPVIQCVIPRVGVAADVELEYVSNRELPDLVRRHSQNEISLSMLPVLSLDDSHAGLVEFGNFVSGNLHILHFAGHARSRFGNKSPSLQVSMQFPISIDDCLSFEYSLRHNPFVILNACTTGTANPLRSSNWAALFWRLGARGVVATEFEVPDSFAAEFIDILYRHLLDGTPVGSALRSTRCLFWETARNPLGLAYSLYASPSIKLQRINDAPQRVEGT